jgi:heat shock protein HslJ
MKKFIFISLLFLTACFPDETISGQTDVGDVWVLKSVQGNAVSNAATLTFPEKGRIAGKGPCNSYFANQTAPLPWFIAGPIGSTKKLCPPDVMTEERVFFAVLEQANLIEVFDDRLILSDTNTVIAEFTKP